MTLMGRAALFYLLCVTFAFVTIIQLLLFYDADREMVWQTANRRSLPIELAATE